MAGFASYLLNFSLTPFRQPGATTLLGCGTRRNTMPDWHILYEAAVEETNPGIFERLVYETEDAICGRLRQLSHSTNASPELDEIAHSAQTILQLKTERLGWPNPSTSLPH